MSKPRSADAFLADARLSNIIAITEGEEPDTEAVLLARDTVDPDPDQPRRFYPVEELRKLGQSIREEGQHAPILVRPHPRREGRYMVVVGGGRWTATGPEYGDVPQLRAIVRQLTPAQIVRAQWSENKRRVQVSAMADARALRRMKDTPTDLLGVAGREPTWPEVAAQAGFKTDRSVLRLVALLKLPRQVQELIERLGLSEKHGRAFLMLQPADEDWSEKAPNANQKRLLHEMEQLAEAQKHDDEGPPMSGNKAVLRAQQLSGKLPEQHDLELDARTEEVMREVREREAAKTRQENHERLERGESHLRAVGGRGGGSSGAHLNPTGVSPGTPPTTPSATRSMGVGFDVDPGQPNAADGARRVHSFAVAEQKIEEAAEQLARFKLHNLEVARSSFAFVQRQFVALQAEMRRIERELEGGSD